ncbi:DUF6090 family protein [Psychroserpens ponticola]|uniref:DUF6090 family protein n=1 Tax=Psychroserpens ponticola TaxID=2932268 RepID=A0ABY7RTU9_9FLAO|nr:DUF6090 family protein [Psychroserpens ponticola]WCO00268.1 DUF6090 family protein [Psychroserpens ponticola]
MEKKKTGKYLKYAIGEIILVVIGILIALSINNWNEGRKSENDKQKLMHDLKQEFSTNKEALENHLIGLEKNNSQLNKVINFSAGDLELTTDSLRLYSSTLYYPHTLSLLNSVQEGAISSGKFEILSDSLKHKLNLLKDYSKSREDIDKKLKEISMNNNSEVTNLILNLSAFPDVPDHFYVQQPTSMHPDFIRSDDEFVRLIKSSKTYSKLFQIYYFNISDQIWIKYGLLRQTNETISLIEKELNKK